MQKFTYLELYPNISIFVYLEKTGMIKRSLVTKLKETAKEFKVVCITGPRQSGKTTLSKQVFKLKPYISLEDPDIAETARKNARKFLQQFPNGAILDEVQRVPELFNYLQSIVDKKNTHSQFILTGSTNFLLQSNISQSMAGRAGYIELMPFSISELQKAKQKINSCDEYLVNGFYPAVISQKSTSARWIPNYIKTYIEQDVRFLRNIGNLHLFTKFLKLCAGRAAQILNIHTLAKEVGVDNKTILAWIRVLESSYIIFLLQPYHTHFNKRVIKSPKLYFYDVGILSHLLGIQSKTALHKSKYYGSIFENFIIAEIRKNRFNKEQYGNMYFFRDSTGNEVDLILEKEDGLIPIEIKLTKKPDTPDLKGIKWFQKVFRQPGGILLHGGDMDTSKENEIEILNWKHVADI